MENNGKRKKYHAGYISMSAACPLLYERMWHAGCIGGEKRINTIWRNQAAFCEHVMRPLEILAASTAWCCGIGNIITSAGDVGALKRACGARRNKRHEGKPVLSPMLRQAHQFLK